jgi:hypothetical protein
MERCQWKIVFQNGLSSLFQSTYMDKSQLLAALDTSTESLIKQLESFDNASFNRQPSPTEWSPAGIAEHLLILDVVANKILRSEAVTSTRPSDSKVALIRQVMEDAGTKRVAPESVLPKGGEKSVSEMVAALRSQRDALKEAIQGTDLSEACTARKHPALGTLTRLEWIQFIIHHTDRHRGQMERLLMA